MAKGCCSGGTCACQIIGQGSVDISGSGLPSDPFIVDVDVDFESSTNKTFTTIITGDGSSTAPYTPEVEYTETAQLDDLPDVQAPNPTNGQVLAWDNILGRWTAQAPSVAPTGAVLHDTSLEGDGSAGTPLGVLNEPDRLLGTFTLGHGLSDRGMASVVQHFADDAARTAAIPAPWLNALTMLDNVPGIINYWTGSVWSVLPNQTAWELPNGAMLELSGAFVPGLQPTVMVLQIDTTTDALGNFDILGTSDLTGRSGVITALITEQGETPWKVMVNPTDNKIVGTAYRVSDGSVMAGTPVVCTAQTILY